MKKTLLAHAAACAPAESCGWVVNTPAGERYFPCQNLSAEPTLYFRMDPADYLQAQAAGDVVALVHSHPDGQPFLSDVDRRLQVQSGLPWWLVCDDRIYIFRCMPFLTGRAFEHGGRTVTPCSEMRTIWRVLRCRILRGGRTGGSRARICIWIIWRRQVFIG